MAAILEVGVTAGVPTSGTGEAATINSLHALTPSAATFTPAATSHTALDCVGGAATFSTVGTSGKLVMLCGASFSIDTTTPVASAFRLHLFNAAPTVIADDANFNVVSADIGKYLGFIDLGTAIDLGSTCQWIEVNGLAKPVQLTTANIVGYLQNIATVTLEAVAHKVTLFAYPLN